jgi:hypothetical protein
MFARAHRFMTALAIARIHLRLVRQVARQALRGNPPVVFARMEWLVTPVGVALFARTGSFSRSLLLVRIVAQSALPAVRITCHVEVSKSFPHLVAAQTLRRAGNQCIARGILRRQGRHV